MPTNTYKFLTDGLFDRQKRMDFNRANNGSFPNSSRLNRSEVPTFSPRVGQNLSPHISPTTRAEICCKALTKSPYSPTSARGPPPLGEADDKRIILEESAHLLIYPEYQFRGDIYSERLRNTGQCAITT